MVQGLGHCCWSTPVFDSETEGWRVRDVVSGGRTLGGDRLGWAVSEVGRGTTWFAVGALGRRCHRCPGLRSCLWVQERQTSACVGCESVSEERCRR